MATQTGIRKSTRPAKAASKLLTAKGILALPREQQDALLETAAKAAAEDYRNNPELTIMTTELATDDFHDG